MIPNLRHGESSRSTQRPSAEYGAWCSMIARCYVPSNSVYPRHGGRGIAVCAAWRTSFEQFLADMGRKPTPAHTLDRIDNAKGYGPGNCRWATWTEQARNKTTNRVIEHSGATKTLTEWANGAGISVQLLAYRLKHGWPMERALSEPPRTRTP